MERVRGYIGLLLIGIIGWACDRLSRRGDVEPVAHATGPVIQDKG